MIQYFSLNNVSHVSDIDFYFSSIYTNKDMSIAILKLFYEKLVSRKFSIG